MIIDGLDAQDADTNITKQNTPFLEKLMTPEHKCYLKPSYYFNPRVLLSFLYKIIE